MGDLLGGRPAPTAKDTTMTTQQWPDEKPAIPKSPSLNTQLANAVAALAAANDRLTHMKSVTEAARREETAARNKVNEAQRLFDALVAEVKKSAPRDSDWRCPPSLPAEA